MKLIIGSDTLNDVKASVLASKAFGDSDYPIEVTVKNLMPFGCSLPEVGLFLGMVSSSTSIETIIIQSFDVFQRLVSSIEQVSSLNRFKEGVVFNGVGGGTLKEAMQSLDKDNPENWNTNGFPDCFALSGIMGRSVLAVERNNAWTEIKKLDLE